MARARSGAIRFEAPRSPRRRTASATWGWARSPRGGRFSRHVGAGESRDGRRITRARAGRAAMLERMFACSRSWPSGVASFAGTLSGGEQQMLAIARCLMGQPRLIMFDEPSLGLAPVVVQNVFAASAGSTPRRHHHHPRRAERRAVLSFAHRGDGERPHRHGRQRRRPLRRRRRAPRLYRALSRRAPAIIAAKRRRPWPRESGGCRASRRRR